VSQYAPTVSHSDQIRHSNTSEGGRDCMGVRRRCLGFGEETRAYFLTSECSGCFRCIGSYVGYWLAVSVVNGLAAPKPRSQVIVMETCGSGISGSGRVSTSGSSCVSGIALIPRPSRARDLVTMAEIGSTWRLTSLERVTTGAGLVSRGARAKPNSLGRSLHTPYLAVWFP